MKRYITILAVVLCINGNVFAVLSGGGTQVNPYLIQSRADFDEFANPANSAIYWAVGVYTKLMCDLNLSDTPYTQAPVAPDIDGTDYWDFQGTQFNAIFEGNNHIISNLTIASIRDHIALFGYLGQYAQIHNLGVENVNITGRNYVGGLAGCSGFSKLTDCYATGSVSGTDYYAGGLVGKGWSGTLTDCYATCSVSGTNSVGGLVGDSWGTLTACYATGSVIGTGGVGGLAGEDRGSLTACYATGSVIGNSDVGGLVGFHCYGTLTASYATGSVSGNSNVGGLVGFQNGSSITNCYSAGLVSGIGVYSNIGGLLGKNWGSLTGCFWDTDTSHLTNSAGGTGESTADMQTLSTFINAGWDFSNTDGDPADWMMLWPGEDYPRLAWQTIYLGDVAGFYGINFVDYAEIAAHWGQTGCPTGCENADINNDGTVDIDDLMFLANNWLEGI